ncbi:MAG: fatty acid desaturase [Acidobacteria bacterium]|nr:fatty acid desaturase [Acidobacteriota bacterium]
MKDLHYYNKHVGDLKQRLKASVDLARVRELHQVRPFRHMLVVARLVFWLILCGVALWQTRWPWLWAPAAVFQGFNLLGFIILLHEQVHEIAVGPAQSRVNRLLGLFYALPVSMSATQFRIWHLDHHNELGSFQDDPKRAHLSPKINARWYKLLYCTPWLFLKYARSAAMEAKCYKPAEQRTIAVERTINIMLHLAFVLFLWLTAGGGVVLRVWVIPLMFCFPVAFILNRLGQHYDIDPSDPAKWSTLVEGNPVWHFILLWSNFHIEHHYFPRVPFYNLRALNRELRPFFRRNGIQNHTYSRILWGWFVLNRKAHTEWGMQSLGHAAPRTHPG